MLARSTATLIAFLLIVVAAHAATSPTLSLYERFTKASPGDYLVAYLNKAYTVLHIYDKRNQNVIVEEITVPARSVHERQSWRDWIKQGAPGHTSWVMYEIEPQSGRIVEFYSFTHQTWIAINENDHFFSTLLNLQFRSVRKEDRKRVGPPPLAADLDMRPLWTPPACFEGSPITDVAFACWRATWPSDGSELAGKTIEAYLPESDTYPNYFPYWIEVRGNIIRAKVRVKDVGHNMISPQSPLPLRPPRFMQKPRTVSGMWHVPIDSPSYFDEFLLIASPCNGEWSEAIQLPITTTRSGGQIILSLSEKELKEHLTPNRRYRFTLSPRDNPRLTDQSTWTYEVGSESTY